MPNLLASAFLKVLDVLVLLEIVLLLQVVEFLRVFVSIGEIVLVGLLRRRGRCLRWEILPDLEPSLRQVQRVLTAPGLDQIEDLVGVLHDPLVGGANLLDLPPFLFGVCQAGPRVEVLLDLSYGPVELLAGVGISLRKDIRHLFEGAEGRPLHLLGLQAARVVALKLLAGESPLEGSPYRHAGDEEARKDEGSEGYEEFASRFMLSPGFSQGQARPLPVAVVEQHDQDEVKYQQHRAHTEQARQLVGLAPSLLEHEERLGGDGEGKAVVYSDRGDLEAVPSLHQPQPDHHGQHHERDPLGPREGTTSLPGDFQPASETVPVEKEPHDHPRGGVDGDDSERRAPQRPLGEGDSLVRDLKSRSSAIR